MNLLCINEGLIITPSSHHQNTGRRVIAGKEYTSDGVIILDVTNDPCYFINEVQDLKHIDRFIPLSEIDETELIKEREQELQTA